MNCILYLPKLLDTSSWISGLSSSIKNVDWEFVVFLIKKIEINKIEIEIIINTRAI